MILINMNNYTYRQVRYKLPAVLFRSTKSWNERRTGKIPIL